MGRNAPAPTPPDRGDCALAHPYREGGAQGRNGQQRWSQCALFHLGRNGVPGITRQANGCTVHFEMGTEGPFEISFRHVV